MRKKGVSSVANRWLNKVYKVLAIMLVLFAVLISSVRIMLPYAQDYRQELQDHINTNLDSNIALGRINIEWKQNGPLLVADNVRILQTEAAAIFIKKIVFHVDFWRTLTDLRLHTQRLELVGAKIYVNQAALKSAQTPDEDNSLIKNTSEIFLEQITKFSLHDSQVVFQRENSKHEFQIDELRWLNQGERHRANGKVIVEGLTENTLNLKLDVIGDKVSDMRGQIYLEAKELDITPWLDTAFSIEDEYTDADINFQAWMSIDKGLPKSLFFSLAESNISYVYKDNEYRLQLIDGDIQVNHLDDPKKLVVESNSIDVFTKDYAWQPFTFSYYQNNDNEFTYFSSVDLEGLKDLLPLFLSKSESLAVIDDISPIGELSHLYMRKEVGEWQIVSDFSGISTQYHNGIPSIENLSGELAYAKGRFSADVLAEVGELNFGDMFRAPLTYKEIKAKVKGINDEKGWKLKFSDVALNSTELTLAADLAIDIPSEGETTMGLLATIKGADAVNIPHYYPHLLMGDNLVNYLEQAIPRGKLEQAVVLLNGPLNDFPFKNKRGIFNVNAELIDSTFLFESDWLPIQGFNANLNFTNNSMLITGRSGRLHGIRVKGVKTAIDDLDENQILTVDATFNDILSNNLTRLMNKSPLADTVGKTLEELRVSGLLNGNFNLHLPLNDLDAVVAKGVVKFENNLIHLQSPQMNFTDVKGELSYYNDVIKADKLAMNWEGLPLFLSVDAQNKAQEYLTTLNIDAQWKQKEWEVHLPKPLHKYFTGTLPMTGHVNLHMLHNGEFSYDANVSSDLKTLSLDLPSPYDKSSADTSLLKAEASGDDVTSTLHISIDDHIRFQGLLNNESGSFTQSHLLLGKGDIQLPNKGFDISVGLNKVEFSQWHPFVSDILDAVSHGDELKEKVVETNPPLIPAPEKINGSMDSFEIFGQTFTDVSFDLFDEKNWWKLFLKGKEIKTEAKFYPDWLTEGVDVNAEFIHLAWHSKAEDAPAVNLSPEMDKEESSIDQNDLNAVNHNEASLPVNEPLPQATNIADVPEVSETTESVIDNDLLFTNMPKLKVECGHCKLGLGDFGKLTFEIVREGDDTLKVKDFVAKRGNSNAHLNLVWKHTKEEDQTHIYGDVKIEDVAKELKVYGYPSTVQGSNITAKYDVTWGDAPASFVTKTFNGNIDVDFNEGYLAEVSDKGTRIFSVLSLQSLVRKLKLDFRDIFSDGMYYSSIEADFTITNGVFYTNDAYMDGAAGDLHVKGQTDLNTQLLNYRLSYKPDLTSSLPVLAWIATLNPVTFLAGVALDKVITSRVVSELKFELTGTISDPILKEVERKNKEVTVDSTTSAEVIKNPASNINKKRVKTIKPENKKETTQENNVPEKKLND